MKHIIHFGKYKIIPVLICGIIMGSCNRKPTTTMSTSGEMKLKSRWIKEHLIKDNPLLPFSFLYDGEASSELLKTWQTKTEVNKLDNDRTQYTYIWTDSITGLEVRCMLVEYSDYPSVEWTVYFKNNGKDNTPCLQNIQGLDTRFEKRVKGDFILHCNKGDWNTIESYEPYFEVLGPNSSRRFVPAGGRPTNGPEGWPYYNLQMPGSGIIIVVGWPGQWASSFTRDDNNGLQVVAGQELTSLYLKPGEEIRTPLIVLQFWQGSDNNRAHNLWRRWYMAHTIPIINGEPPKPMTRIQLAPDLKGSEEEQFIEAQAFEDAGIDVDLYWHDAGWYPCDGVWHRTGTWEMDKSRFPNGFKPIADWIHARGKKLIVWFEPERVGDPNSWLARNHPEWLLGGKLLNLGNPEAQQWVIEKIDSIIKGNDIDFYRQDFNMDPLSYWRANDSTDRQGITENFHVQGYLAFWDELKRRNPNMLIDACASGGRRNDLETMRRAVPLLRSDFVPFSHWEGQQAQTYGLSRWLPYFGLRVGFPDSSISKYVYRSFLMPFYGIVRALKVQDSSFHGEMAYADMKMAKVAEEEFHKVAPMMFGDYYPLTPYSLELDQWMAWQFDNPEQGEGLIQAFRRENCEDSVRTFKLSGLNSKAQYEVTNFDVEEKTIISGKELMGDGLKVEIRTKPGAALISYKQI
ncbi:MAG TPA: alpha-galactosidase [Bacteroidales bacterium]|nr:alpha-galactosidase [Bacteroidales bacterium]